jgi:hypothetical protein
VRPPPPFGVVYAGGGSGPPPLAVIGLRPKKRRSTNILAAPLSKFLNTPLAVGKACNTDHIRTTRICEKVIVDSLCNMLAPHTFSESDAQYK